MSVENTPFHEEGMVVFCAANAWSGIPLADHHMAMELSKRLPVVYVDPPVSTTRKISGRVIPGSRLRIINERLVQFTPLRPPKGNSRFLLRISEWGVRRQLAKSLCGLASSVHAVISAWPLISPFGVLHEETSLYWVQDDYIALASYTGWNKQLVDQNEVRVARSADVIITSSPAVQAVWEKRGFRPTMIPFGCPPQPPIKDQVVDIQLKHPRAVFVGHINARIDLSLLEELNRRGVSLVFIGPRELTRESERLIKLLGRPGVQWLGPINFDNLPTYLSHMDIGLVPYNTSDDFNKSSFPLKTLEYLAAGLPVVSTTLPASEWLCTDLIHLADGPERYADVVQAALAVEKTHELALKRRQFAESHSWKQRIDQWMPFLCQKKEIP